MHAFINSKYPLKMLKFNFDNIASSSVVIKPTIDTFGCNIFVENLTNIEQRFPGYVLTVNNGLYTIWFVMLGNRKGEYASLEIGKCTIY